MSNKKWYEQICLPNQVVELYQHPWSHSGGIVAANHWMAVWLLQDSGYRNAVRYADKFNLVLNARPDHDEVGETTVEALREWTGEFELAHCERCYATGFHGCPECHDTGDPCEHCDNGDEEFPCGDCGASGYYGFDRSDLGELGGVIFNLKLIAPIVNNVPPGSVMAHMPPIVDQYKSPPLLLVGNGWKAAIMPTRDRAGKPFEGWIV